MLNVDDIRKTFNPGTANEVRALRGVSLKLAPARFLVVIGSNGSGKSTFLNAVAGSFRVDSGRIALDGNDVTAWPEHRRASMIGRVFQNPFHGSAANMSIAENIALAVRRGQRRHFGRALSRRMLTDIRERVRSLNMGLEDRLENEIGSLSGGQRQALTLLMATWVKPKLLLLDEHTAALDPKSADVVIRLSDKVIRKDGLTALMVTHSMAQAVHYGDELLMMHRGNVVMHVGPEEKRNLTINDLLARFEDLRRRDQMDAGAAEMLQRQYV